MNHSFTSFLTLVFMVGTTGQAAEAPVSFHREIFPILRTNCIACHKPSKSKGQLDLTTHAALLKGGKHGPALAPGQSGASRLVENISGDAPAMPDEGEPLTPAEVALIQRWIEQGARDDTPSGPDLHTLSAPPIYTAAPAITALAWSPRGNRLAVAGYHEVLLWEADGQTLVARLGGHSPVITSLAFSADGAQLAVAGGAASEYGEIQIWDVSTHTETRSIITTGDTVFGVSFSPDATRVAVGCADKTVRAFSLSDGRELMKCDNHIDWVLATAFSTDGARVVSAGRDRAVKLIDLATGRLIDDVNKPRDVILSLVRNPGADQIVFGDDKGGVRIHRMEPRGGRLAEGDDKENSFVRECERLPGAVPALAWSPDGASIAAGCLTGEARVFRAIDGKRAATLKAGAGAIFSIAFDPESKWVATGGFDGEVRVFNAVTGELLRTFTPVPIHPATVAR